MAVHIIHIILFVLIILILRMFLLTCMFMCRSVLMSRHACPYCMCTTTCTVKL
jgi:hypothetical protein